MGRSRRLRRAEVEDVREQLEQYRQEAAEAARAKAEKEERASKLLMERGISKRKWKWIPQHPLNSRLSERAGIPTFTLPMYPPVLQMLLKVRNSDS